MATNLRAPATEDIWHLSIDDLFAPLPEKPRLGGPGPFVINLSSSMASMGLPTLKLAAGDSAHAYEIQRNEDGRTRYRLRLGPFETEEEADVLLDMVREIYPSALAATAGSDDLKAIASIRAKAAAAAEARRPTQPSKKPEPALVAERAEPAPAKPQPAAAPPALAAAKPVALPQPVVLEEAISFNVDISFADIDAPKMPNPLSVEVRTDTPLQSPASRSVEPPLLTERAEVKIPKPTAAAPMPKERAPAAAGTPPAMTAPVKAPLTTASPVQKTAPVTTPSIVSPVKKPASIWSSLPVASRSTVQKPQFAVGKPAMSVSAPLVRRPPAASPGASAAKGVATAKPVAPAKSSVAQAGSVSVAAPPVAAAPQAKAATGAPKTPHPQKPPAAGQRDPSMALETTETMRAITTAELDDKNALAWYVIELATANLAFDPDTVPNLDIFAEYRLYTVAELGASDVVHSLRVGFFSAEIAAKAVASYLSPYYDKPAIKRVSIAERERFKDRTVEARKDVGATGRHAVIEITDDLVARRRRSSTSTPSP